MEQSKQTSGRGLRSINRADVLEFLMKGRAFLALIVVVVIFAIMVPGLLQLNSIIVISVHVAGYALLAIGMTFVILSGGIDLSVGSIVGVTGMIAGGLINEGIRLPFLGIVLFPKIWMVIVLTLLFGVLLGAINGIVISRLKVAPFIATLGMMYAARGLAGLRNNGYTFPNLVGSEAFGNEGFPELGSGTFIDFTADIGIPWPIWIMILFAIVAYYVTTKVPFGRHVYALGGNRRVAQLSGVRVKLTETMVYVISGLCSAMAGLILTSRLVAAHPVNGTGYELTAIAAVVLGGTSLMGGRGSIGGTVIGAFVIGVLVDGLILKGYTSFLQNVIKGIVIVLAVFIDSAQIQMQERLALQRQADIVASEE